MCIIIDANTFAPVFDTKCTEHNEFRPVYNWIIDGKGKLVYGGEKYRGELKKAKRYHGIIMQLLTVKKVVEINDAKVKQKRIEIENSIPNSKSNDSHILAISLVSGCKLLCSKDASSYKLVKKNRQIKIYSSQRNRGLLNDRNIVPCCRPCRKLTRKQRENLEFIKKAKTHIP